MKLKEIKTEIIAKFTNTDDNVESQVAKISKGISVVLLDLDSGKYIDIVKIFKPDQEEKAMEYAKKIANVKENITEQEKFQLEPGLSREEALKQATKKAKEDHRGFTYDPKTGIAILT